MQTEHSNEKHSSRPDFDFAGVSSSLYHSRNESGQARGPGGLQINFAHIAVVFKRLFTYFTVFVVNVAEPHVDLAGWGVNNISVAFFLFYFLWIFVLKHKYWGGKKHHRSKY